MSAVLVLAAYAVVVGFLVPRLLLRSRWPHRAPALGVAAWHALAVSFTLAVALTAYHLAAPTGHLHAGLIGFLHSCGLAAGAGLSAPDRADRAALVWPAAVVLLLLGSFGYQVYRAQRHRLRHLAVLDLVGRHSVGLRATVLEHSLPAAYCLPGRRARVVVSEGALRLLSAEQLEAVLEHERAHIAGRHHLALAAAEAFAKVFPWVPLARHAREQTALLLEMIADDRALRHQSRDVLATAMYQMAAARAPQGAFAVGGTDALVRLQRILAPPKGPHPALWGALASVAVAIPVLPFLVACTPGS